MDALSDEQLLREYLLGRSEWFELLVRRHSRELFHFAFRLTGSAATAEDVVQETFLQVHRSSATFDPSCRFRPWIFTIAANKARDQLRGKKRRPEMTLDALIHEGPFRGASDGRSSHPSLNMESEERSYAVRRLVDQLPNSLREVLILGYYHGFRYKDMAGILGVPLGTVKSRLHAAVLRFGELHAGYEQSEVSAGSKGCGD